MSVNVVMMTCLHLISMPNHDNSHLYSAKLPIVAAKLKDFQKLALDYVPRNFGPFYMPLVQENDVTTNETSSEYLEGE